jgi:hypothetical protein
MSGNGLLDLTNRERLVEKERVDVELRTVEPMDDCVGKFVKSNFLRNCNRARVVRRVGPPRIKPIHSTCFVHGKDHYVLLSIAILIGECKLGVTADRAYDRNGTTTPLFLWGDPIDVHGRCAEDPFNPRTRIFAPTASCKAIPCKRRPQKEKDGSRRRE